MKTILVSGASGIVGYGILRSLRLTSESLRLVGTTIHSDSVAPAFCDVFELAPPTNGEGYLDWLCSIILKYEVDLLIPSIECDMYNWNENRATIESAGTRILLNNPALIELCRDKWLFYSELAHHFPELAIPTLLQGSFEDLSEEYSLPFLLKPRCGFASKGIIRVDNRSTFDESKSMLGSILMAQPIVGTPDTEYTVSAFFDQSSDLCCHITLKRKLSTEGFTQNAEIAALEGVEEILGKLGRKFLAIGPTNFQFRLHREGLKLLEINPRISSATSIRAALGYNESLMGLDFFLSQRRPLQPKIRNGRAVRFTEDYIFYDCNNL